MKVNQSPATPITRADQIKIAYDRVPTEYDRTLLQTAVAEGYLSVRAAAALVDKYAGLRIGQAEFQDTIAVARRKGAAYIDKAFFKMGGVATLRKRGDFEQLHKIVQRDVAQFSQTAKSEAQFKQQTVRGYDKAFGDASIVPYDKVPTDYDRGLLKSAVNQGYLTPKAAAMLANGYGENRIGQGDFQDAIAVSRVKGGKYVESALIAGGVSQLRNSGDLADVRRRASEALAGAYEEDKADLKDFRDIYGTPSY